MPRPPKSSAPIRFSLRHQRADAAQNQLDWPAARRPFLEMGWLLVLVLAMFVHCGANNSAYGENPPKPTVSDKNKPAPGDTKSGQGTITLPKNVAEMRDALLAAARSADIEELRTPYEWNELPPAISKEKIDDPIEYWKKISRDGEGREILMIIDKLLQLEPTKIPVGRDYENNALYVWPYLSELDLKVLTPRQQFEFRTLVPPKEAREILENKKWTWWRLSIGADGTWHSFMKFDR